MEIVSFTSTYLNTISCYIFSNYVPKNLRYRKKDKFLALEQGGMYMSTYESKFHVFSRYSTQLVAIDEESIRFFMKGLNYEVRVLSIRMTSLVKIYN